MKIAFVHDWFTVPAGAEKVACEIIDVVQPAGVFALFNFMDSAALQGITRGRKVSTSFLQGFPLAGKHYRMLAPLYPRAISKMNVSDFDIVISSSWMAAKGIQSKPGQIHISYCHTPMRFAWGLEDTYLEKYGYNSGIKKMLARLLISRLRQWDERSAQEVDHFIANSAFVAQRIFEAYGRESTVIYPPVNTRRFTLQVQKEDYYFTAARFVDYKNLDLIVKAFTGLGDRKLLIAGSGPMERNLKKMAGNNVHFLGWISDDEMVHCMQGARAFVNASVEDFGIAGLEAQSCGTPVIALGKGGYTETVIENETGIFFHREHPEALADAVLRFERQHFDPKVVRSNAQRFDSDVFREKFLNFFLDKCFSHAETLA